MKAGRELDKLIAVEVMGWKKVYRKDHPQSVGWHGLEWMWDKREGHLFMEAQSVVPYSTNISSTWQIIEKLEKEESLLSYSNMKNGKKGYFVRIGYLKNTFDSFHTFVEAEGDSFSHAICLAALEAVGYEA